MFYCSWTTEEQNVGSGSVLVWAGIGGVVIVLSYGQVSAWLTVAHRQSRRIRSELLGAILHQEMAWFDTNQSGSLPNRLSK